MVMTTKTKSMKNSAGERKLAANAGRKKQKSGGEAQKETSPPARGKRAGSAKQRKG
jgi:hypothetical protein